MAFSLAQPAEESSRFRNHHDEIHWVISKEFGNTSNVKKLINRLYHYVVLESSHETILDLAIANSCDQKFVSAAVPDILGALVPGYSPPKTIKFETEDTGEGLLVASNLDFREINEVYHRNVSPDHSSISEPYILANLLSGIEKTYLAASSDSEMWANPAIASVARAKIVDLVRRTNRSARNIELFEGCAFDDIDFSAPIIAGEKTFADLLSLLERSEAVEFRSWLLQQPDDGNLVREYQKVLRASGWQDRMPYKISKLFLLSGIGISVDVALGTMGMGAMATVAAGAIDLATGASDEFLLSKLRTGWKPNQFVDGPAREYLGLSEEK